ncbi:DUF2242 domain-containing protein [Pseudomonas syringae]|uniref:DUF2242 domain-containing protein n=1 Tax=Pseudomonas syringae TaxID=317 RepID=A0A9Q4A1L1_PSESX|nr:DUF2242 domain-containing protein [Pseudomonas syringae]MCF5468195.1 DUF2242 domain-containing protein [Pseudomonas syringae]MCF5472037.1 DUF2242 domain-containing protein [Pseudomonas syringae]MCF5481986.1 DUF2242 domain-containing protein [Pseudomonas syringae]MCF5487036.1 DUF2242 domain-containing protein [Pseudomonas syringae]MCF5493551.1 DUF2242 domain-containing protein [Pseudomonas syringae]
MFKLLNLRTAFWAAVLLTAAGCSSPKQAIYDHEHFDDAGTFSRSYPATDLAYCEAGRRALLSQGYIITSSDPKMVSGRKSFQQTGDTHIEISFNLVCAADMKDGNSTMFANALQDRYALKKTNNSASLGVGVLGSVSMPIGSTDDSMVKVASETVSSAKFYERFFGLVENFLPPEVKKAAHIVEKPKAELGVPDAAPAAAEPAKAVEPAKLAPETKESTHKAEPAAEATTPPAASEPMPAPVEPASFKAESVDTPAAEPVESPAPTETAPTQ